MNTWGLNTKHVFTLDNKLDNALYFVHLYFYETNNASFFIYNYLKPFCIHILWLHFHLDGMAKTDYNQPKDIIKNI